MEMFLKLKDVESVTKLKRSTLYSLISAGKFPQSIKLIEGGRAVVWRQADVESWMQGRIAASGAKIAA